MFKIPLKPLSVNDCWRGGRRFNTKEYIQYNRDCSWFLNSKIFYFKGEIEIIYKFYINNYSRTDVGNLEKPLTDILVKNKVIADDRYVKRITLEKFKSKEEYIEIEIKSFNN